MIEVHFMFLLCFLLQNLNILASIALGTAAEPSATAVNHLPWDYGCVREDQVWLCCNEKDKGTLGIVSLHGSSNCELEILSCKVIVVKRSTS